MDSFINPDYEKETSIKKIQEAIDQKESFPSIILTNFFKKEFYKEKEKEIKKLHYKRESIPDQFSFAHAKANPMHILDNKQLLSLLSTILKRKVSSLNGEAYYFSWKDYTLLHDKNKENAGIDILIDFTEAWEESFGGQYIFKDIQGRYLKILSVPNAVFIIERKQGVQKYLQYINNLAKGKKRYFLLATIKK
ncbi:hypothetical protein HZA98_00150 [Candidatus Woesearchaeota archaeon]|nr:hypothetical protein [Candidatus Woesearchaeota archaeon]